MNAFMGIDFAGPIASSYIFFDFNSFKLAFWSLVVACLVCSSGLTSNPGGDGMVFALSRPFILDIFISSRFDCAMFSLLFD